MKSLIQKCGGEEIFTQRLDTFFTHKIWDQRYHIGLFQIANEPGFLIPSLYNYVNRQDKTAEIVRYILKIDIKRHVTEYRVTMIPVLCLPGMLFIL